MSFKFSFPSLLPSSSSSSSSSPFERKTAAHASFLFWKFPFIFSLFLSLPHSSFFLFLFLFFFLFGCSFLSRSRPLSLKYIYFIFYFSSSLPFLCSFHRSPFSISKFLIPSKTLTSTTTTCVTLSSQENLSKYLRHTSSIHTSICSFVISNPNFAF